MYTRCPKCSTCFRVTDRHLAIAKGKVRCGKCQLVFNATENAIDDLPKNPTNSQTIDPARPSVTVTPTAKTEVKKPVSSTHVDKVATPTKNKIEKPVKPAAVKKEKATAVPPPKVAPPLYKADATMVVDIDNFDKDEVKEINPEKPSASHNAFHGEDDSFDDSFDLDAAIDELTEHADEITYDHDITDKNKTTAAIKPESSTPEEKQNDDVFTTDAYDSTNATSVADILDEMEGQLTLDIPDPNEEIKKDEYNPDDEFEFIQLDDEPEAVTEPVNEEVEDTNDEFIKNNFDIDEFDFEDDLEDINPEKEGVKETKADVVDVEELFEDLDADIFEESKVEEEIIIEESSPDEANIGKHSADHEVPLQLRDDIKSLHAPAGRRLHPLLKFTFVIFLVALSFTQLAYFRSHELVGIIPSSRPLLEQFCDNVGCQYSGPSDTKQIQLQSRDVRLHPKEKKALLISAAMINNAYFAQPYPNIHIRLSDISGNIVAERIFNPKTYMGKLSNPFLLMRSKTPVHINFEVVDPGKDAVNFEFTFL